SECATGLPSTAARRSFSVDTALLCVGDLPLVFGVTVGETRLPVGLAFHEILPIAFRRVQRRLNRLGSRRRYGRGGKSLIPVRVVRTLLGALLLRGANALGLVH